MTGTAAAGSLAGGGEMARRVAAFDWSTTALGPLPTWSTSRRNAMQLVLQSRFPMFLWLGPDLVGLYNDAYRALVGRKHPAALGRPAAEVWPEIWDVVGPLTEQIMSGGPGTWSEDLLLVMQRSGFVEETYFTFAYSPFTEDGRVAGVFAAVTETTERVVGERRLRTLRRLSEALAELQGESEVLDAAVGTLEVHGSDVCAAAVFLRDGGEMRLRAATATAAGFADARPAGDLDALLATAPPISGATLVQQGWRTSGAGSNGDGHYVVEPLRQEGTPEPYGAVIVQVNPRRPLDADYLSFLSVAVGLVSGALVNARAYEIELQRGRALAALDEAKTAFFHNVSHEFRTPLTLMLGPLADALEDTDDVLTGRQRERVAIAARNGRRMKRLVDSLLGIARLDGDQYDPTFVRVDLPALTAQLVAGFESAYHQAGVELVVDAAAFAGPVWVDSRGWESIVLNLLSNALKYTHDGTVTVRLREHDQQAVLEVADTGIGIADDELPRVFERFHRVRATGGRSAEGAGVGLALVRATVELHGGEVTVESAVGVGSTFTVAIPTGDARAALDDEPVRVELSDEDAAESFVAEAERWSRRRSSEPGSAPPTDGATILVVDDNADMRSYLEQVLRPHWAVVVAADGRHALELARQMRPRLVVSDVMMPDMDGVELVHALRALPELGDTEVILLSARAGEDDSLIGLEAGADDYVAKPFTATDLVRRVRARLSRVEARDAARQQEIIGRIAERTTTARTAEALAAAIAGPLNERSAVAVIVGVWEGDDHVMRIFDAGTLPTRLRDRYRLLSGSVPHPMVNLLGTDQVAVYEDTDRLAAAGYDGVAHDARAAGYVTMAVVPLLGTDGRGIGSIGFAWRQRVAADAALTSLLDGIGRIAARGLERINIFELQRRLAESLQEELLATSSRSTIAAISTHYHAADDAMMVGGDWYDAVELSPDALAVGVGDVVGAGLPAIRTMSQLRTALATAAVAGPDVATTMRILGDTADRILGAGHATAAFGILHRDGRFEYSVAGHLPPLVATGDGRAELLWDGRSPPLASGLDCDPRPTGAIDLAPGSTLVLYTDGLVERRDEPLDSSLEALRRTVASVAHLPTPLVRRRLVADLATGRHDDTALLLVRPAGSGDRTHTDVVAARIDAIPVARHALRGWLEGLPIDEALGQDFVLAVNEALTNAIEHGSPTPTDVVTLEAALDGSRLVACISDRGRWERDARVTAALGRGRGIDLIHRLCDHVDIDTGRRGSTVTLEVDTTAVR